MVVAAAWVLDISVGIKWYLRDEDLLEEADAILARFGDGELALVAPSYFLDEAANILRSAVRRNRIAAERAQLDYAALLGLNIGIVEATAERRSAALTLALEHDIAYYDALYLQLSDELRMPLVTADRPFYERVIEAFPRTLYLGPL